MTTLELARRIATAARQAKGLGAATQAVLATLDQNDAWFCRSVEDADGLTVDTPYEQRSLFRKGQHANGTSKSEGQVASGGD
jgi:hypothetical protein